MAPRHILEAAVVPVAVIERDPAGQVLHRDRPGPIRIILVPGDHPAMPGRLAEKLVVPEPHRPPQELRRRDGDRRVPEQVVEPRLDPPGPEGVEEDRPRVGRLVGVILIPEVSPGVVGLEPLGQLPSKRLHLIVIQDFDPGDVAVLLEEGGLFRGQPVSIQVGARPRPWEKVGDWGMAFGQIDGHGQSLPRASVIPVSG